MYRSCLGVTSLSHQFIPRPHKDEKPHRKGRVWIKPKWKILGTLANTLGMQLQTTQISQNWTKWTNYGLLFSHIVCVNPFQLCTILRQSREAKPETHINLYDASSAIPGLLPFNGAKSQAVLQLTRPSCFCPSQWVSLYLFWRLSFCLSSSVTTNPMFERLAIHKVGRSHRDVTHWFAKTRSEA